MKRKYPPLPFAIPTRLSFPGRRLKGLPSRPYYSDDGVCVVPLPLPNPAIAHNLCVFLTSDHCYQFCFQGRRWPVTKLAERIGIGPRSSRRKQTLQRALTIATAWFKDHGYHLHVSIADGEIGFAFTLATEPAAVEMRH
jgi:hypothetical protein